MSEFDIKKYIRANNFPQMWCPGCGHGIIMGALLRAIGDLGLENDEVAIVSGIGCSSRIAGYLDFNTAHTMHGRALPTATGVKLGNPNLKVIVPFGDGDSTAIGGNHFIHSCRRNIDITAIIMNNRIYGMTGGQYSPMSGKGVKASTAPYGVPDPAFDLVELAKAAGASFVARSTVYHAREAQGFIKKAIAHKGFSVVEIATTCPIQFGRKNKSGDAPQMVEWFKDNTVKMGSKKLEENPGLIQRGIFLDEERPEYCEAYQELVIDKVMKKG
ncbi:MAG: 2-oxoacid:ferredoxin oxidoreductase subunit beta [Desulfobacter postgatei]|uniref:2-oxoacid:ferredoxin oxidoreductase subunit beta n=1 Tax=Desulfobacter postgatei TaxID=2293 RepID=A0A2G6MRD2_9BACT|nr:MAG: 2-oxoacid:ferredoxin oxidoreductase subunit beta [Desulfobacter postgatei]